MILGFCLVFAKGMSGKHSVTELSIPQMTIFCSASKFQEVEIGHTLLNVHFPGNQV